MNEKPILFSAPMVLAILAGRKTQTRRMGKIQNPEYTELGVSTIGHATKGHVLQATYRAFPGRGTARWAICQCPYGLVGDRLWVKETLKRSDDGLWGQYTADGEWVISRPPFAPLRQCWHSRTDKSLSKSNRTVVPSIHMPRRASRITLEIVNVRVERLHDISEKDAAAEGVKPDWRDKIAADSCHDDKERSCSIAFGKLWRSINGLDSWKSNPWVWVIDFKQVFNGESSHAGPVTPGLG